MNIDLIVHALLQANEKDLSPWQVFFVLGKTISHVMYKSPMRAKTYYDINYGDKNYRSNINVKLNKICKLHIDKNGKMT